MNEQEKPPFAQWCIIELLGHVRLGGFVSEVTMFGAALCRIDVPDPNGEGFALTQFVGAAAIYRLTPCSEEAARAVAAANQPRPVSVYEMPKLVKKEEGWGDADDRDDDEAWKP
jgi:hypothetical protein